MIRLKKSAIFRRLFMSDMSISISEMSFLILSFICLERALRSTFGSYNDGTQPIAYGLISLVLFVMFVIESTLVIVMMEEEAEEDYQRKMRAKKRAAREKELKKQRRKEQAEINAAVERQNAAKKTKKVM